MMTAIVAIQGVILIVLGVLVTGLLRAYASVLRRLHDLDNGGTSGFRTTEGVATPRVVAPEPGADAATWPVAHDISGAGLAGDLIAARVLGVPHDTVLIFLSSGCSACQLFWEQLGTRRPAPGSRLLVITKSPEEESPAALRQLSPPGVDVVMSSAAWSDYRVPGSPYVIVVNGRTGRVRGEGSGTSLDQLTELMRVAGADAQPPAASAPGGVRKPRADREREVDVDRVLLAAGIGPGHPSLYGDPGTDEVPRPAPGRSLDLVAAEPPHPGREARR